MQHSCFFIKNNNNTIIPYSTPQRTFLQSQEHGISTISTACIIRMPLSEPYGNLSEAMNLACKIRVLNNTQQEPLTPWFCCSVNLSRLCLSILPHAYGNNTANLTNPLELNNHYIFESALAQIYCNEQIVTCVRVCITSMTVSSLTREGWIYLAEFSRNDNVYVYVKPTYALVFPLVSHLHDIMCPNDASLQHAFEFSIKPKETDKYSWSQETVSGNGNWIRKRRFM